MKVPRSYQKRLADYLRWRVEDFLRPVDVPLNINGPGADEAMFAWETHGIVPTTCKDPRLLSDYIQGKKSRDWHITEWRAGSQHGAGLFLSEEFIGTLGCTMENFESIFGRPVDEDVYNALKAAECV